MSAKESRPGGKSWTAPRVNDDTPSIGDLPAKLLGATRCVRCHRPLRSTVSASRGYGPQCWTIRREALAEQLQASITAKLAGLADQLPRLDLEALDQLFDVLADALDQVGGSR